MKRILSFAALLGLISHASAQNVFPIAVDTKIGIGTIMLVYPLDVFGDVNVGNVLHFANRRHIISLIKAKVRINIICFYTIIG